MAKYFMDSDFECHCCEENKISPELVDKLDELRERWGGPIEVKRGYSCEKHNAEVGGASNSRHLYGDAADICLPGPFNAEQYKVFYGFVCGTRLFSAVGYYPKQEIVHVDIRPGRPNEYGWNYDYPEEWFYGKDC